MVNITTKEEISTTKEQVENALQQYKSSGTNVPAFKEQVSVLEEKIKNKYYNYFMHEYKL